MNDQAPTPDQAAAAPAKGEKAQKPTKAKTAYVRAPHGNLTHLFTNVVFGADPKKVEIDGFLQAQIDAGKLEIVTD